MGRVAAALASMLVAACFAKPPAPGEVDGDLRDSGPGEVIPPGCVLYDNFAIPGPGCGVWGAAASTGGGSVERVNGELWLSTMIGMGGEASCTTIAPTPASLEHQVHFVQVAEDVSARTGAELTYDSALTVKVEFIGNGLGQTPSLLLAYAGVTQQNNWDLATNGSWFRVSMLGATLVFEVSKNGSDWNVHQSIPLATARMSAQARLYLVFPGDPGRSPVSKLDDVGACP